MQPTFRASPGTDQRARWAPIIAALVALGWSMLSGAVAAQSIDTHAWPNTDFAKTLVALSEIQSGGPPKDGIPPIDAPRFVTPDAAAAWLDGREPVIVVRIGDTARAYPLQILIWHEIVNDTVGGVPVSVTFCPLCNASIVFDRRVGDVVLDFGTTGKLRKSDLVMYDRQSESWWQQFSGRAIVGERAGTILKRVPASIVSFADFVRAYPGAEVLSRETGHRRAYGNNPYRGYDTIDDQPFLFFDPVDPRLPPMERVLNVSVDDVHRVYPFAALADEPVINDEVGGVPVVVLGREGTLSVLDHAEIAKSRTVPSATAHDRRLDGRTLTFEQRADGAYDRETGSRWDLLGRAVSGPLAGRQLAALDSGVHFAFAWLAFNPRSEIYRKKS